MEIIILLIGVSLLLVVVIGWVFWWAVGAQQFADLERAGRQILHDDE
jgi:cbb3-type cytochrome oxidase maturation protein